MSNHRGVVETTMVNGQKANLGLDGGRCGDRTTTARSQGIEEEHIGRISIEESGEAGQGDP